MLSFLREEQQSQLRAINCLVHCLVQTLHPPSLVIVIVLSSTNERVAIASDYTLLQS